MSIDPKGLSQLGQPTPIPASPDAAKLERVPNPHAGTLYLVRFTTPEFTSICPVTGQPDFGTLVIDYARTRQAQKRGGGYEITSLPTELPELVGADVNELERLSQAIDTLAQLDPSLAQLVDLKFFCGYSLIEIAGMRGISERTAQREWDKARVLLKRSLEGQPLLPK